MFGMEERVIEKKAVVDIKSWRKVPGRRVVTKCIFET
jgi:hypothetical protein